MIRTRISVPTRLDQARDAIDMVQRVLSELARRELSAGSGQGVGRHQR